VVGGDTKDTDDTDDADTDDAWAGLADLFADDAYASVKGQERAG
jgi:hypothetical protein